MIGLFPATSPGAAVCGELPELSETDAERSRPTGVPLLSAAESNADRLNSISLIHDMQIRFEDECMEIQSSKPSLNKIKLKKEMSFKYNK